MSKCTIELKGKILEFIKESARMRDMSIETFIAEILNKYAVDPHIMEKEDVKAGYEEMGEINIKLSN